MSDRENIDPHLRNEPPPAETIIVVRGGPDTPEKLNRHAERTHRAYLFDGEPLWAVSVFAALDPTGPSSLEGLLVDRLATYKTIYLPTAGELKTAGFALLATFRRPHYSLIVGSASDEQLARLLATLGEPQPNPHFRARRR